MATQKKELFCSDRAQPNTKGQKHSQGSRSALLNTRQMVPSGSHPHSLEIFPIIANWSHQHRTASAGGVLGLIIWPHTPNTSLAFSMFKFKVSETIWRLHCNPAIWHFQSMQVSPVCCACSKTQMPMLEE